MFSTKALLINTSYDYADIKAIDSREERLLLLRLLLKL